MTKGQTAESYGARLQRVIKHIHDHLDEPLELDRLAGIACLSRYHFHRIYRSLIGETVADTVARLRLQRAANSLARTGQSVSEISQNAGYGSAEAFSRAFQTAYRQTPTAFRTSKGASHMTVEVQNRNPMRLVTVSHHGPAHEIGFAFNRLVAWAGPRGLLKPGACGVAVYLDDMGSPQQQRSLAGLTVDQTVAGDDMASIYTIPGGRHAMILHKGAYAKIGHSYAELYRWLSENGLEPADAPLFEVNLNNPRNTPPEGLLTEICVPLTSDSAL
jgi:AraC family transcriptional regulator